MKNEIEIVLATYNGEKFLDEQLSSIVANSKPVDIIAVDDRSTDNTIKILEKTLYADFIQNIVIRSHDNLSKGPCCNFSRGLRLTTSDYVMLSDQDDYWLPNKIEDSYNKLIELENMYGKHIPLLVFTDLAVVDEKLVTIASSFFRFQGNSASWASNFSQLMTQNVAPGCTMIFNRALLNKALPIHENALMHDWWLLLTASAFGKVDYLSESTIKYRQHDNNQVGAKRFSIVQLFQSIKKAKINFIKASLQAKAFLNLYDEQLKINLPESEYLKLCHFSELTKVSYFTRLKYFINGDFRKNNLMRNLGLLFILITYFK